MMRAMIVLKEKILNRMEEFTEDDIIEATVELIPGHMEALTKFKENFRILVRDFKEKFPDDEVCTMPHVLPFWYFMVYFLIYLGIQNNLVTTPGLTDLTLS